MGNVIELVRIEYVEGPWDGHRAVLSLPLSELIWMPANLDGTPRNWNGMYRLLRSTLPPRTARLNPMVLEGPEAHDAILRAAREADVVHYEWEGEL